MYRQYNPAGETIEQIVLSVPGLPAEFLERGIVCINAQEVKRELWSKVRPLPDREARPIMVTLYLPPAGGRGGGGAKMVLGLVASIALLFATAGIAGGALATASGWFAAGSISAKILAGAVGLIGALAISALTAPPAAKKQPSQEEPNGTASADGNAFDPGGAIPCVIGTRKIYPNLIGDPIIDLVDQDEFLEAAYALNGPHRITDIRESNTDIAEAQDLIYEVREGWPDDAELTYVRRQGKMLVPQVQLSEHIVDHDNPQQLKNKSTALDAAVQNTDPTTKLPKWHGQATRRGPDEVWIHLLFGGGLGAQEVSEPFQIVVVPFRVRIKPRGSVNWINLPEVHVGNNALKQFRYGMKLFWGKTMPVDQDASAAGGWLRAYNDVPGQDQAPVTAGWQAHSYFVGGGGSILTTSNYGSSGVINTRLAQDSVEFYLDGSVFPRVIYDVEIKRGCAYAEPRFNAPIYLYDAPDEPNFTPDFFYYRGTAAPYKMAVTTHTLVSACVWSRIVSVWNEYPVLGPGLALIAVKALNRPVSRLSCIASRYVKDWDGTGWNRWTTTSNPAPHYADVLCGDENLDPLPLDLRDDAALVDWRQRCDDNDWTCDAIIEDVRTQDVLLLIASSAYARPYQSEKYGVTVDYDRSDVTPTQIFSQRNSRDFRFERAFARLPDGMVVNFADELADYDTSQIVVFREGRSGGGTLETVTYDGLTDEDKVRTRTKFDLDQAELRATFYYITTNAVAIRSTRGDLVGLQNDALVRHSGAAIIKHVYRSGDQITGFGLDVAINVGTAPEDQAAIDANFVAMPITSGLTGIAIRRSDDTLSVHEISDADGLRDIVTLTTPIDDPGTILALDTTEGRQGSQIVSGPLERQYRRMLVSGISPKKDYGFDLTLVDEAPTLVRVPGNVLTDDVGTGLDDDDGTALRDH